MAGPVRGRCGRGRPDRADVGIIRSTLPGGRHEVVVSGVYTYRSGGAGKLAALRAFWEFDSAAV